MTNVEMTHEQYTKKLFDNADFSLVSNNYKNLIDKDEFFTKVTGVTYDNRQGIITNLIPGQELFMKHDVENEFHVNAIKLLTEQDEEVGFLPRELADEMIKVLSDNNRLVFVEEVTGEDDDEYKGVNIVIQKIKPVSKEVLVSKYPATMKKDEMMTSISEELGVVELYEKRKDEINTSIRYSSVSIYGNDEYEKNMIIALQSIYRILRYGRKQKILYLFNDKSTLMESSRMFNLIAQKFDINIQEFNPDKLENDTFISYMDNNQIDILISTYGYLGQMNLDYEFGLVVHNHIDQNLKNLQVHQLKRLHAKTTLFNHHNFSKMTKEELEDVFGVKMFLDFKAEGYTEQLALIDKRNIKDKDLFVFNFLYKQQKTIVYASTRKKAVDLAKSMKAKLPRDLKYKVVFYHAGLSIEDKKIIEEKFKNNEYLFIIATTAFDIALHGDKMVENIFIYNPPYSYNTFLNQIIQTSKFNECKVYLIYSFYDVHANKQVIMNNIVDKSDLIYVYKSLQYMLWEAFKEKYGYFHCKNHELRQTIYNLTRKRYTNNQVEAILKTLEEMRVISFEKRSNDCFIEVYNIVQKSNFVDTHTYINSLALKDMFVELELLLTDNVQKIRRKLFE